MCVGYPLCFAVGVALYICTFCGSHFASHTIKPAARIKINNYVEVRLYICNIDVLRGGGGPVLKKKIFSSLHIQILWLNCAAGI